MLADPPRLAEAPQHHPPVPHGSDETMAELEGESTGETAGMNRKPTHSEIKESRRGWAAAASEKAVIVRHKAGELADNSEGREPCFSAPPARREPSCLAHTHPPLRERLLGGGAPRPPPSSGACAAPQVHG